MKRISLVTFAVLLAVMLAFGVALAAPGIQLVWDQGFEQDTAGWFDSSNIWNGTITRVASGTNGISSAAGGFHAEVDQGEDPNGPFSRFDGYRDTWTGPWEARIDVYLDPNWADGTGFDYSVAANGSDGNHQRDFIFHVTKDTSTGNLLVGGSNNTNFAPREDLETINHYVVPSAGWYTLQHLFYASSGALAVDLNLLDTSSAVLFTETRSDASDTIPAEVGGNRYAWFTAANAPIAVDNHQLLIQVEITKELCKNNGWQTLTRADGTPFKNQGDCIQYANTGK